MKKIFISQPMKNRTDAEIKAEREEILREAKEITGEDVEEIKSFFADDEGSPLELLGKSLMLLAKADAAYFKTGWSTARGCKIEHIAAVEYKIPIIKD